MVQELSRKMNIELKKQIFENSVEQQIQQIQRITGRNGKIEYRVWTYTKNEVVLQPSWIRDAFEFREPEFYKLVTTVTHDDDSQHAYTVPVERFNKQTSVKESKYEEKRKSALIVPGESIPKKEPSKIPENKKCTYTLFLLHPPYSINKAIIIHVFYRPWH